MRRDHYESETNAAKAREKRWRMASFGLLAANVVLSLTIYGTDTTEKTVIVPPTIERQFWVKGAEVSPEYLEEMARYLSTLVLNVTSKSVDANVDVFLRYVAPESFGAIRSNMGVEANRLKLNSVSTAFYPVEYQTRVKQRQTVVTGDFVTMIGKQVVSTVRRTWRFSYSFVGGRLWISEFVEVRNEDPFGKALDDSAAPAAVAQ